MTDANPISDETLLADWPLRPWLLGGLLALAGLLIYLITDDFGDEEPWRAAAAAFAGFGGLAAAFTLTQRRPQEPVAFALIIGLVMGGIAWQLVSADGHRTGLDYAFAAGCFFSLLALPLFQSGFHRSGFATAYKTTHFHVWADAISGGGALAFTGLSWAFLALLDGLFGLIGIDIIGDLMSEEWFGWTWSGAAFGAGLGVIRNNLKVIGALQNVVMLVFALLAVPFALALAVFLIALIASGGTALWDATDSATPILLACAAGSFVLFNAIIRDSDVERSTSHVMLVAALALAAVVLPLCIFAAISIGIRVDQHGLSPERIWALIAVAVASAYGLAAWVALARGRMAGWSDKLREANLKLAAGVCVLAFILALPMWDFGAISARDQVARLNSGEVSADEFDFAALRWDFGDAGREALGELAQGDGEAATLALEAKEQDSRPYRYRNRYRNETLQAERLANFTSEIDESAVEGAFERMLRDEPWRCESPCRAIDLGKTPEGARHFALIEGNDVAHFEQGPGGSLASFYPGLPDSDSAIVVSEIPEDATIEVRDLSVRRIYVDGKPVGPVFD